MLPVMDLHRLRIDVRLERGGVIRKSWQLVRHEGNSAENW